MKQGLLAMQQAAIDVVVARFAELQPLARTRIVVLDNLECLQHLIIDLSIARSQEEMECVLLSLDVGCMISKAYTIKEIMGTL
jgi:hypothetical protein